MFDYQRFGLIYVQVLPRQWHLGVRVKGGGKPLGSAGGYCCSPSDCEGA